MKNKTVSFRAQLKGTISDFLRKEDMSCPQTEEALLELVVALSHYTEEGLALFPQVVVCDEMGPTLSLLQCSDPIRIGTGPRNQSTIAQALKRCATLARSGWVIYIQRLPERIEYGLLRSSFSPTALGIRETVRALGDETQRAHIIVASQLGTKSVELIGACSGVLNVYLSATPDDAPPPEEALERLSSACCADVEAQRREQVSSFMRSSLSAAIRHCHGTLIAVKSVEKKSRSLGADAVIFERKISLTALVKEYELQHTDHALAALNAYASLLTGIVATDGIVLLDSTACLIGYNLFIKQGREKTASSDVSGGARRRAYNRLCAIVDRGELEGCFIHSSDGVSDYYSREDDV